MYMSNAAVPTAHAAKKVTSSLFFFLSFIIAAAITISQISIIKYPNGTKVMSSS